MMDLSGVFVPTATPFEDGSGDLDPAGFRANLLSLLETPNRGLVIGGSTGEAVLLDESERIRLLEIAMDAIREAGDPDRVLIAGTGAESLRATRRLTRTAAQVGAGAVLVQPPAFFRGAMTDAVVVDHYRAVADGSPVPVVLYQVPPKFSTLEFSTEVVATLSEHPNIVGVKDSRGSVSAMAEWIEASDEEFQVLSGNGAVLLEALEAGAVGGILGVSNLMPAECAGIVAGFSGGNRAEAAALQERVGPVHTGVVGGMGIPGVKAALDLLGRRGGRPRRPLQPLPEGRRSELEGILRSAELI